MAGMAGEYKRSEARKEAYAIIAGAGSKNADADPSLVGLVAAIDCLARMIPPFASLLEHPDKDVRRIATEYVAREAVGCVRDRGVAAIELIRTRLTNDQHPRSATRTKLSGWTGR